MTLRPFTRTLPLLLGLSFALASHAETYEVKMLNRGAQGAMVYEPDFVKLTPGDKIKFLASSNGHDAASIAGMLPEGASPFKGKINEEIEVTFTQEGLYGIKCLPHYAMGMVMLVQVGDAPLSALNVPADAPARAKQRFENIAARTIP
ncbi:pseudoazurin [Lampropedia puyangensis]|uniref:Pseudoazurin n=1 Tax=Lampropedia puyangensis TaxID=1330072 RepID=A0A4S8EVM9_9BURK|nr:pseudoazurin [Lampropedia puyangensis]THT98997.1 pseudoazurin [Lampropedia puyangensis]